MARAWRWPLQALLPVGDAVPVLLGLVVARFVWLHVSPAASDATLTAANLLWLNPWMPPGVIVLGLWFLALWSEGLYDPLQTASVTRTARALSQAAVLAMVGIILVQFFLAHRVYSRLQLVLSVITSLPLLALWRLGLIAVQRQLPMQAIRRTRVLVIGTGRDASLVGERITGSPFLHLVGTLDTGHSDGSTPTQPVLGTLGGLREVVNTHDISLVVLACRQLHQAEAWELARVCGGMGLDVLQVPFTFGLVSARLQGVRLGDGELMRVGGLAYPSLAEGAKRAFDLVLVLTGGALVLPGLLVVAALIKLEDGGPVLYVSKRAGRGGRTFDFYKFRSMVPDADSRRDDLPNETDGRLFKLAGDPRITRIGRVLRRWSIDELPQLLNVLNGDMNLVGPRPLPVEDLAGIEHDPEHWFWFEQRGRVKPGITGLWQVKGRSDLPFKSMVDLDVHYIQDWSLLLDLEILLRTIPAVLRGRGAR